MTDNQNQTVIKTDNDGHRYLVPINRAEEFDNLMQDIYDAKFMSDAWYDANDALDFYFGEFMVG
jgi:hypothetical protein